MDQNKVHDKANKTGCINQCENQENIRRTNSRRKVLGNG
jgi:hypothetical protein